MKILFKCKTINSLAENHIKLSSKNYVDVQTTLNILHSTLNIQSQSN